MHDGTLVSAKEHTKEPSNLVVFTVLEIYLDLLNSVQEKVDAQNLDPRKLCQQPFLIANLEFES